MYFTGVFSILCSIFVMVYIALLPEQISGEETITFQTCENARVKDEDVEQFWTRELSSENNTGEVKLEGQHITETQVS